LLKRPVRSLLVCVLVVVPVGAAAFANPLEFSTANACSVTASPEKKINCNFVGYHLASGPNQPVNVDGVYLSFNTELRPIELSIALLDAKGKRLCHFSKSNYGQLASETRCFKLVRDGASLPTPDQVYYVMLTLGEISCFVPQVNDDRNCREENRYR
jgi:hypothetical protein